MLRDRFVVDRREALDGRDQSSAGAEQVAHARRILGIVARDLAEERLRPKRLTQRLEPEVERPQLVEAGRGHHRPDAAVVTQDDCRSDGHRLHRRLGLGEHDLVLPEQPFRLGDDPAHPGADDVELEPGQAAGFDDGRQVTAFVSVVAEDEGSTRTLGLRGEKRAVSTKLSSRPARLCGTPSPSSRPTQTRLTPKWRQMCGWIGVRSFGEV